MPKIKINKSDVDRLIKLYDDYYKEAIINKNMPEVKTNSVISETSDIEHKMLDSVMEQAKKYNIDMNINGSIFYLIHEISCYLRFSKKLIYKLYEMGGFKLV